MDVGFGWVCACTCVCVFLGGEAVLGKNALCTLTALGVGCKIQDSGIISVQVLDGGAICNISGESEESGGVGKNLVASFALLASAQEGGAVGRGEVVRMKEKEEEGEGRLKQNLSAVGAEGGEAGGKTK